MANTDKQLITAASSNLCERAIKKACQASLYRCQTIRRLFPKMRPSITIESQPEENEIVATYIVFTRESTQDQSELDIYLSKVRKTFEGHPIKVLAAYGPQQVLEGAAPEGVVIAEFPTTTAAREWYDGPAYQAVVQHRFKGASYRAVLVEGV